MVLETFKHFPDFKLIDSGNGYRLEQWGQYRLARPDPQAIWKPHAPERDWNKADATFSGTWKVRTKINQPWTIHFPLPLRPGETKTGDWQILLNARLTPFKHTGIFAEQAANWEWIVEKLAHFQPLTGGNIVGEQEKPRILNLFGYTGAASILLAKLECSVTHVDASKPSIALAKENQALNKLPNDSIRWILDDAAKFVKREVARGNTYDAILMDPPAFGHAPSGKTWKFAQDFPELLKNCVKLLSPRAQFLLINAYATNSSALALRNLLEDTLEKTVGEIEYGELCLKQENNRMLSTGIFARWSVK